MTILDTLITDRTQDDVERARALCAKGWGNMTPPERAAYLGGLKGGYGPTDMNRVREALEYIDRLMVSAKRESVFEPVPIDHAEYNGAAWRQWTDVVTVSSDYVGPDIYFSNINRFWAAARRFAAVVLPRYNPDGNGYIKPETAVDAGEMYTVTDSVGLMELRVTAVCPASVTAEGAAWVVSESDTGWTARLNYPAGPYPEIEAALAALKISCGADAVTDALFTLSATLRYGYEVTAGTCAVRWSPYMTWGEARTKYGTWGEAKPRTWEQAARGGESP